MRAAIAPSGCAHCVENCNFAAEKISIMKKNIHDEEDRIFGAYQARLQQKGLSDEVSADGLHYLGCFEYSGSGTWGRQRGDEEAKWAEACRQKRGLVVLTKDLNDEEAWDIREEHGRKNGNAVPEPSTAPFYRNLRAWVYGLVSMNEQGVMPAWPDARVAQAHFEETAWVRMNLKKVPGGSTLATKVLQDYIGEFKDLLLEQLALYAGASIYVDCANREGVALLRELYADVCAFGTDADPWIYYSEKGQFIVVNTYHPSYVGLGQEHYDNMREAVADFFKAHPHFGK